MRKVKVHTMWSREISPFEYEKSKQQVNQGSFVDSLHLTQQQISNDIQSTIQCDKPFSIPMKRNMFHLYEIEGKINDKKVRFLIDTGAQMSVIRSNLKDQLHLDTSNIQINVHSFSGNQKNSEGCIIDRIEIGGLSIHHHPVLVLDQQQFSMKLFDFDLIRFDAILGWDILSRIDFELDDVDHQFKVIQNKYTFKHPNMIPGSFPLLLVRYENEEIMYFGLDSGASISWLSYNMMKNKNILKDQEVITLGFGVHGKEKTKAHMASQCVLFLDRARIELHDAISGITKIFDSFEFDGVFGNDIFRNRRIRFVNSQNMILFV